MRNTPTTNINGTSDGAIVPSQAPSRSRSTPKSTSLCFFITTQTTTTRWWTKCWITLAPSSQKAESRSKSTQLEKAQRFCLRRRSWSDRCRDCGYLSCSRRYEPYFWGVFASWCNGSTRDSESLCLGSNPSEAESHFTWHIDV